jgi:hypothetical protein
MRTNDVFPSRFLKAADIGDEGSILVITSVAIEEVGDDEKPVVHFDGEKKGLVLNRTNWDRLAYIAKTDESREWSGLRVELYKELVTFNGRTAPAIRVRAERASSKANPKSTNNTEPPDWTTEEISAA